MMMGGGLSMGADPQIPKLSFGVLLSYALGPFYGLRLATIVWFCCQLFWTGWTAAEADARASWVS